MDIQGGLAGLFERMTGRLDEQPWVTAEDLLGPDGEEFVWDFCAEVPGWLWQVYRLYTEGRMSTMDPVKNMEQERTFEPWEVRRLTAAMAADEWLLAKLRKDVTALSLEDKEKFLAVLPDELTGAL